MSAKSGSSTIFFVQLGPRKLSIIQCSSVSAIQGLFNYYNYYALWEVLCCVFTNKKSTFSYLHSPSFHFQPPDPTANLTFNLTLTEREKEDRSQVVLPYTHTSERKPDPLQVWVQGWTRMMIASKNWMASGGYPEAFFKCHWLLFRTHPAHTQLCTSVA